MKKVLGVGFWVKKLLQTNSKIKNNEKKYPAADRLRYTQTNIPTTCPNVNTQALRAVLIHILPYPLSMISLINFSSFTK